MSFATPLLVAGSRMLGGWVVVAERRWISNDCSAINVLLCLLDVNQERLELGCLRVAVADKWCQRICKKAWFGQSDKPPMQRDADLMNGIAFDDQFFDPFRHHCN